MCGWCDAAFQQQRRGHLHSQTSLGYRARQRDYPCLCSNRCYIRRCQAHDILPHSLVLSCILLPTWLVPGGHIAVLCWVPLLGWVTLLSWVPWLLLLVTQLLW